MFIQGRTYDLTIPIEVLVPNQSYEGSKRAVFAMPFEDNTVRRIMHGWYWLASLSGMLDAIEGDTESFWS